jgi:hypothetical protein
MRFVRPSRTAGSAGSSSAQLGATDYWYAVWKKGRAPECDEVELKGTGAGVGDLH